MRLKVLASAVAALTLAGLATTANASQVIFSDLGPGQTYNSSVGYGVYDSTGMASGFTSAASYDLSQIDVGLSWPSWLGGADEGTISLWRNTNGALGTLLGTWQVSGMPSFGSTNNTLTTISNITGVHLDAGSYWLLVQPPATNELIWNFNSVGVSGAMWSGGQFPDTLGAFDIIGTPSAAPEPAAWAMMILGLATTGALLRRRHKLGAAEA